MVTFGTYGETFGHRKPDSDLQPPLKNVTAADEDYDERRPRHR